MLDIYKLKEMEKLKKDIEKSLLNFNVFYETEPSFLEPKSIYCEEEAIDELYLVKFMVAGAFYPSYYKTNLPDLEDCQRMLSCKDPRSSLCIRGFQDEAFLYHNKIKEMFSCCSKNIILHYETNKQTLNSKLEKINFV